MKILKNCIQCKRCQNVIESKSMHGFVTCSCGTCSVDGGLEYLRRVANGKENYIELSVTEPVADE